jgi:uncharacterized protein
VILVDTSGLLSALDSSQRYHRDCAEVFSEVSPPFLLSPFVLAELDYLLMRYAGHAAQSALLEEVARGAYQLEPFSEEDIGLAKEVLDKYADLNIRLADASIVVLAQRHNVLDVLTLDQRHFRAMRVDRRKRFKILPFDDFARQR